MCVALAIAGGLTATTVRAEEITERERELLIVIESLKERVTALEEREAASAPAALTERVEALETTVEDKKEPEPNDFRVYWKDGLNMDTVDESTKLKIGVQVHNDWFW